MSCLGATHIPAALRTNRAGHILLPPTIQPTRPLNLRGVIAHLQFSWSIRVRRERLAYTPSGWDTQGSAVAGLRDCWVQPMERRLRPTESCVEAPFNYFDTWQKVPPADPLMIMLSSGMGAISSPYCERWAVWRNLFEGAERRAARRERARVLAEALLGGCAGNRTLTRGDSVK